MLYCKFTASWASEELYKIGQYCDEVIMAAPSYAGRQPFCFTTVVYFFFRRLISEVAWPIVAKLCHMFDSDLYLLHSVRNLGTPSVEIWRPKNMKFWRDFGQLRDLIANISGKQQDVANYGHSRTGKLNSVYLKYFGPQTAKNRTGVLTHPTGGHQAGHCHAF